jgi:hypothetical protein
MIAPTMQKLTIRRVPFVLLAFVLATAVTSLSAEAPGAKAEAPADITGKWTASFDTQIGKQEYTYEFVQKDTTLTGKMKSNLGSGEVLEGKVEGDKVSFVEMLKFQDMEIRITYAGTMTSADEIKFTRNVADFATEELVAKRVK